MLMKALEGLKVWLLGLVWFWPLYQNNRNFRSYLLLRIKTNKTKPALEQLELAGFISHWKWFISRSLYAELALPTARDG